jgi:hypothetical protein
MYTYSLVLQILIHAFRILVFGDVPLDGRSEIFKTAKQRNNNAVETSNLAVATFVYRRYGTVTKHSCIVAE